MKGKKTDAITKAKIIEEKINNPDLSSRDMEKIVWVDHSTITRVIDKDLQQVATESQRIASLIDRNDNLQSLADKRLLELLASPEEKLRATDLVSIRDSTFKQNEIIKQRWEGWDKTIILQI